MRVLTTPTTGWVLDSHGLAHQVHDLGPICARSWCLRPIMGPVVAEIRESTRRCQACARAVKVAAECERETHEVQRRLW